MNLARPLTTRAMEHTHGGTARENTIARGPFVVDSTANSSAHKLETNVRFRLLWLNHTSNPRSVSPVSACS